MLGNYAVHVVLLSRDLAESRGFYHDKLGLEILDENEEAITFRSGSTELAVTKSTTGTSDEQTQAGWHVDVLEAEVRELRGRGVEFQVYRTLWRNKRDAM